MLDQEKEYSAWGLSKIAVRNIVVFFLLTLMFTATVLWRENIRLQEERQKAVQREVQCKEEAARIIDLLRKEQIQMLTDAMNKQQKIEQEIEATQRRLAQLKRKK